MIAHSVATMAALNLADVAAARTHVRAGILGSEELRLPVLRAQLRWMEAVLAVWQGDFAEAERHHAIAAHVHEQTELYEAGSGLIAIACLLREKGESIDPASLFGSPAEHGGEGMVGVARAALLSVAHRSRCARRGGRDAAWAAWRRRTSGPASGTPRCWPSCAPTTGWPSSRPNCSTRLTPHRDELAVIGQVGIVGPVALATARLHALLGDDAAARCDLSLAEDIARRGGGVPSLLRARLLACELDAEAGDVSAAARELADDAERIGMRGVAAAARRLAGLNAVLGAFLERRPDLRTK